MCLFSTCFDFFKFKVYLGGDRKVFFDSIKTLFTSYLIVFRLSWGVIAIPLRTTLITTYLSFIYALFRVF